MRSNPTAAEATLWQALRDRRLDGWKFRRQQVIAGYIVDFWCATLWLAVEVDGPVHRRRQQEDRERDDDLARLGVRIVRLRNDDVIQRLDQVLDTILRRCHLLAAALSVPSPVPRGRAQGGGRRGTR